MDEHSGKYRWSSPDVIAAMLVRRKKKEKQMYYCFVHQHGRLIVWLKAIYIQYLDIPKHWSNLI